MTIVSVATTSSEGSDRGTLSLGEAQDSLVAAAAAAARGPVVVVVNAPGAVLMPWSKDVDAILLNFMPGEQGGSGQADVLWGDVNPAARLPVTLPNADNEVGFTEEQYPGVGEGPVVSYSEGLLVGYRWCVW